jgi:hypothetical protein
MSGKRDSSRLPNRIGKWDAVTVRHRIILANSATITKITQTVPTSRIKILNLSTGQTFPGTTPFVVFTRENTFPSMKGNGQLATKVFVESGICFACVRAGKKIARNQRL